MPRRAGYFVLAYAWDHHCQAIFESLEGRLRQAEREVRRLEQDEPSGTDALLDYYARWRSSSELYRRAMAETRSRQYVINSLGYRGYGVNRDLLSALGDLERRYAWIEAALADCFRGKIGAAGEHVQLPPETTREATAPDFGRYFDLMSGDTPWQANTAIFERMFFSTGVSSVTIMKGSTGLQNGRSCREMKLIANRNFVDAGRELFATLHLFTDIGIDLLKWIHYLLMKDLGAGGGEFRTIDFPDRNGVTFEFDNFGREISDLAVVLGETARSFHNFDEFLYNLARSYYMFIGIHPFWDANGRAGRCFLNLLLVKKGLPPVVMDDREEVPALPRYGGSMEDMHRYLLARLRWAMEVYFYERWKLESFGFLHRQVYNAAFDSGFHFRQIGGRPPLIEVGFEAYVCGDPLMRQALLEQGAIAFPEARFLHGMAVHCGFCEAPFKPWRRAFSLSGGLYIKELAPRTDGVRRFDVDFAVEAPPPGEGGRYFACSVTSEEAGLIFNNQGLNYAYLLDGGAP
jgi:hypothetical protein